MQLTSLVTGSASNLGRIDGVTLEFAVEGCLADAQQACGFELIVAGFRGRRAG
jgi:hypothetical protein